MGGFGQIAQVIAVQQLDYVLPGLGTAINIGMAAHDKSQAQNDALTQQYAATGNRDAVLRSQYDEQERKRKDLLRRTLATNNANFGAFGGTGGGSFAAVQGGYAAASAMDGADATSRLGLNLSDLAQKSSYRYRRSLLDAKTADEALITQGVGRAVSTTRLLAD